MCEIWKWIIITTLIPLVAVRLWHLALIKAGAGQRWLIRLGPYQRLWWLGVFVLIVAVIVYGAHCNS